MSDENRIITFNSEKDPSISSYETIFWKVNEFHDVEFFPKKVTRVYLISNQYHEMKNILHQLENDNDDSHKNSQNKSAIAIDLEWEYKKLCLIQFCANNICIIIRLFTPEDLESHKELKLQSENEEELLSKNDQILKNFLSTHKFYGKGMHNDKKMLLGYFGLSFSDNFEDIEKTRLSPYNLSKNFNQMTLAFAGEPTASFKVIEMTKSDFSVPELSFRQVLYAAFDTVALYYCYPNFPPIKNSNENNQKPNQKQKQKVTQEQTQNPKNKQKPNIKYYKKAVEKEEEEAKTSQKKKKGNKKKGPKMNLSVVFKKREKKETYSYLITNYQGTKNRLTLRSSVENLDFISFFDTETTSYLFISSFSPIDDFSTFFQEKSNHKVQRGSQQQKTIEVRDPDESLSCNRIQKIAENVFLLPKVPFELCNDTDVLFITNLPDAIFDEEKLQELFYCFGFDQIVSRIDDKSQNSCIVEPRNEEISKRIRTFLPFVTIDGFLLKVYEYPTFLRTIRISNIPSNFSENDLKELFIQDGAKLDKNDDDFQVKLNQLTMIESSEFILRRIESDSRTAYVIFKTLQDKDSCISRFNHFKLKNLKNIPYFADFKLPLNESDELLIIPFTSDVHLRYLRSYELTVYLKDDADVSFDELYEEFRKFGKILQMNYDDRFKNFHVQYYRRCDANKAYECISSKNGSKTQIQSENNDKESCTDLDNNDNNDDDDDDQDSSEDTKSDFASSNNNNINDNKSVNNNKNNERNDNNNNNKNDDNNNNNKNNNNNNNDDNNNNNNNNNDDNNNNNNNNNDDNNNNNNNNNDDNNNNNNNDDNNNNNNNNDNNNNNNNDDDISEFATNNDSCNTNYENNDDDDESVASSIIVEMHPDGSTVIVRDLPMEISDSDLVSIFGRSGRITNLVFRDLTPMNMLSVVDIFFSSSEEAKRAKSTMNKQKVGGTSIHVSIRSREDITDWKMSQRNQWVIFDSSYMTLDDVFNRTERFGHIIDYNFLKGHFLAMFDTQENAKSVIDELCLSYPTYHQFVEETNNSNYLEIVQKPSIPGNPAGPKEAAIVVDPIPDNLTEDFIEKIFCEGNATSAEEASSIVLASSLILPPLKDIIKPASSASKQLDSDSKSEEIECEYPHELFITDSVKFRGKKRLVVYSPSNNVTKKLFTLLVNSEFEGKYFKPKKIDIQDLENPPPRKNRNNMFEGHEVTNPVVAIDPLPDGFGEKEIRETINELPNFEMVICNSAIAKGRSRAVLMPRLASQRRIMLKALSQKLVDNENLHVFKYKCDSIPPPL